MLADNMMQIGQEATQGNFAESGYWYGHPMMFGGSLAGGTTYWLFALLHLLTWVLVVTVLIALIRLLWKKGDKVK